MGVARTIERGPTAGLPKRVAPDLVLVSCVKSKRPSPAPAKDLYVSPLFRGERTYAESTGAPWFILSAEYGLLGPDDLVAPYERYLPDESPSYRRQWGERVLIQLRERFGDIDGRVIEIHAGSVYVGAIADQLRSEGAIVVDRLKGKTLGQRLAWYADSPESDAAEPGEGRAGAVDVPLAEEAVDRIVDHLRDRATAVSPAEILASRGSGLRLPGLYSWWVDESGARDLSAGLGHVLGPGLVYAGLAGATRWPSGKRSSNSLWSRISGMHLGSNRHLSTFRMSLCAVLSPAGLVNAADEQALTNWMGEHLRVIALAVDDADQLGRIEEAVLRTLDPPLNLRGMEPTLIRQKLTALRRAVS